MSVFHKCGSVTKAVRKMGYPTRRTMYCWIHNENKAKPPRKSLKLVNTELHPRNPSAALKMEAIHRCFELGESVQSVSEDIGYTRASIYTWRRKYLQKGAAALMDTKDIKRGPLNDGSLSSSEDVSDLKKQIAGLQMEVDILKETINVLKKDPGADLTTLTNREKTAVIGALKNKYQLSMLREKLYISKSSYYYQMKAMIMPDKYAFIRCRIIEIFSENNCCYGYRRIYAMLLKENMTVSEKVIRRIMKQESLDIKIKKRRKYNSYKGEISPAVPNIINRDFHADMPNLKWLTDITEFAIPEGKIYLSALVDCFDGFLPCWNISTHPDSKLVNDMLDRAVCNLEHNDHPVVHTDRGCQYRWPGWIDRMEKAGLVRSMSKKGCSPDNSACEGLFGRLKNEMFYNNDWTDVSIETFIDKLNGYLIWYNEKRIKKSLNNMSPKEYRHSLGIAV